ncbi:MAG: carbon-nitrogen hydrolase family protein [Phototrophicaceae bacterium]|jgi:N-carbamoylputrescine amidase
MRLTITQLPTEQPETFSQDWEGLCEHTHAHHSNGVILPEMPFYRWLPASQDVQPADWQTAVETHLHWIQRLPELGVQWVAATRPTIRNGARYNTGFLWGALDGLRDLHDKVYLPNEDGVWEAAWYSAGAPTFVPFVTADFCAGFTICSEIWFTQAARAYGQAGATVLFAPRATEGATLDKWLACGRTNAAVAGAYHLSANRVGAGSFGGGGWAVDPNGNVLAVTTASVPFITLDLDLTVADAAKSTYPRYIADV